ncbi:WD40-repeat-containing domain protein [Glomus cerebriforme]|uniref:WD40-repeat-containing domain protein n=1 Tax=Glomus cerebriforme TaxID=658196 RepID=A0A397SZI5_9GLOM|nr:WD40-repeat-containing domain protein [Glomus cerebriforme]
MSDHLKNFFDPRPSTPPWSNFSTTNPHFTIAANHTWNDTSHSSSKENQILEKASAIFVIKHNLNSSLTALSASPDHNHIVVAGREVLKVLNVSEREITEEFNLKNRSFNKVSNDVKWGNISTKNKIATAATNGTIVIWDIGNGRTKIDRKIDEHSRAVNRICFNPTNGSMLLSASQDCTMKLWDLRESDPAKFTFEGKCENVRDVQFNSINQNEFAAAFENGAIQKWDIRKPSIHERKLNAHIGPVLAVDWHSDGRTIASGGRDKFIKIWDMNSDSRNPRDIIGSMTSIARVQWRPNHPNEIASCALLSDNRIFIWNIRRPFIASYYFAEHEDVPTGFLWHDSDVLWSCSKDKIFIQQHMSDSYRPLDLLSKCSIGWSVYDKIAFSIEKPNDSIAEDQQVSRSIPPSGNQFRIMQKRISPNIIEPRNELQQKTGIASLPTFDHKAFSYLAENYIISSRDIWSVCEHNAKIAWDVQRFRTAQTWKIIQLLYGILEPVDKNTTYNDKEGTNSLSKDSTSTNPDKSSGEIKESDSIKDLNTLTEKHDEALDDDVESVDDNEYDEEEEFGQVEDRIKDSGVQQRRTTIKMKSHTVQATYNSTLCQNWDKESIMSQLLDYYAEQGDVQMCVTLMLVLGDRIKISQERVEQWFFSYIELLHRFQLWCAATYIISSCRIPSVEMMNQQSTTIYTTCNNCFRPILNSRCRYWICDKCRKMLNPCSICHNTVKGLYTWCQGCSHGGHLAHMKEWFSVNDECPTGCGHNCSGRI